MGYNPPARGNGTTSGWVAPGAIQDGLSIRNISTGAPIYLRGATMGDVGTQIQNGDGIQNPNLYPLILTLGGNFLSIHLSWENIEPVRPQGGNPATATWTSRDYTGNNELTILQTLLTWADANNVWVVLNISNSGGLGTYWGGSLGYPQWLWNDAEWVNISSATVSGTQTAPSPNTSSWTLNTTSLAGYPVNGKASIGAQTVLYTGNTGGTTLTISAGSYTAGATFTNGASISVGTDITNHFAPLPYDRTHYSQYSGASTTGGYSNSGGSSAQGLSDAETALYARHTTLVTNSTSLISGGAGLNGSNVNWYGDGDQLAPYIQGLIFQLLTVGGQYPCVVGYKFFNEPKSINLQKSFSNNQISTTEEMLKVEAATFDYARSLDPQRFICFSGQGGNSYQVSPDFSILWSTGHTGGGPTVCPAAYPFVEEIHWYTSGQSQPNNPFDNYSGTDNQTNVEPSLPSTANIYAPGAFSASLSWIGSGSGTNLYSATYSYSVNQGVFDGTNLYYSLTNSNLGNTPSTSPSQWKLFTGDTTYEIDAVDAWATAIAARGVPTYFGEWGISTNDAMAAQYIYDMDAAFRRHLSHHTYFNLGTSVGRGLTVKTGTDGNGNNTYALNSTTGPALQTTLQNSYFLYKVLQATNGSVLVVGAT